MKRWTMHLNRASDLLVRHQQAIEQHLFTQALDLFAARPTVTLFDLTNTFLEGTGANIDKAKRGHSKERRRDCPLLTLALVLDGSGFVRKSKVFAGNVREHRTLGGDAGGTAGGSGGARGDGSGHSDRRSYTMAAGAEVPVHRGRAGAQAGL